MNNNIIISRTRDRGAALTTSQEIFNRLERAPLPGCPFKNYFALDLIRDLIKMYDYLIPYGHAVPLEEFLKATNDAHAIAYIDILTA